MIPLRVVANQKDVRPVFFLENIAQFAFIIPLGERSQVPLDRGAVQLEARVAELEEENRLLKGKLKTLREVLKGAA